MKGFFGIIFFFLNLMMVSWAQVGPCIPSIKLSNNSPINLGEKYLPHLLLNANVEQEFRKHNLPTLSRDQERRIVNTRCQVEYYFNVIQNYQSGGSSYYINPAQIFPQLRGFGLSYSSTSQEFKERYVCAIGVRAILEVDYGDRGWRPVASGQATSISGSECIPYQSGSSQVSAAGSGYQSWNNSGQGSLVELQRDLLLGDATEKMVNDLLADISQKGITFADQQQSVGGQQAEPPLHMDPIGREYGRSAGVRTVRRLTQNEWEYHLDHPRAIAQYILKKGGRWVPVEDMNNLRFEDHQAIFDQQVRQRSRSEFFRLCEY